MQSLLLLLPLLPLLRADRCNAAVGADLSALPNVMTQLSDRMVESVQGWSLSSFQRADESRADLAVESLSLGRLLFDNSSNLVRYRNDMFYLNYTNVTLEYTARFNLSSVPESLSTSLCGYYLIWGKLDEYQQEWFFNIQWSHTQLARCLGRPAPAQPEVAELLLENGFQEEFVESVETQLGNVTHYSLQNLVLYYTSNLVEVYPQVHLLARQEGPLMLQGSRLYSQFRFYLLQGPSDISYEDSPVDTLLQRDALTVAPLSPVWPSLQDLVLFRLDQAFLNQQFSAVLFSRGLLSLSFQDNYLLKAVSINGHSMADLLTIQQLKTIFPFIQEKDEGQALKLALDLEQKPFFAFKQVKGQPEQRLSIVAEVLADFRASSAKGYLGKALVQVVGSLQLEVTPIYQGGILRVKLHDLFLSHLKYAKPFRHAVLQLSLEPLRRHLNLLLLSALPEVEAYLRVPFQAQSLFQELLWIRDEQVRLQLKDDLVTLQVLSQPLYNRTELADVYAFQPDSYDP